MDSSSGNRFATLSDQDIKLLSEARHEENTKKATKFGCIVFSAWLSARGFPIDYSWPEMDIDELSELLKRFYAEVRKKDGTRYCKTSMISIRAAINRKLNSEEYNRSVDIISDQRFKGANNLLEGLFKTLTAEGLDVSKPHCPLEKK